ncbi:MULTISPECIES: c-type cytochrome [unclassified Salipiger]|uniref:c-type cytochrome n=1 Tax=unclassified Salipiger TaxID=2640570 RepID=UPI00080AAD54|nr:MULTISPECIES: c-type cytochrome [unclassified Salipiger]ANT59601.1 3-methyladenine DNA glycosylase [Salipiger sp. CCB-MM3]
MFKNNITALGLALGMAGLCMSGSASAQSAGETEYMNACAACHGESGVGDGPLAELMTVDLPDLTQISANNDGEFPMLEVIQIIDGRSGIRGHGYPMPVWGQRFKEALSVEIGAYASEIVTRGRILALAQHLESMQQ